LNFDRIDWVLIQRYVTGKTPTEASLRIEQWMFRNPENEKLTRNLLEVWNLTSEEDFELGIQMAWNQFQSREKRGIRSVCLYTASGKKSYTIYHLFRAAAFILVAVVAGFFFQHISVIHSESDLVIDRSQFYTMQELSTDRGEKARVTFVLLFLKILVTEYTE
jgi:transmembrane sensor